MLIPLSSPALKCDLRDDRHIKERLVRYGTHPVQYEEGLAVARRIRASRYLGECHLPLELVSSDLTIRPTLP